MKSEYLSEKLEKVVDSITFMNVIADEAKAWLYDGVCYRSLTESEWRNLVRNKFKLFYPGEWREYMFKEIFQEVMSKSYKKPEELKLPENWVLFNNVILNIETLEQIKYSPEIYAINPLPYDYTEEEPTLFLKMIDGILPDPTNKDKVLSYFKYCLTTSIKYQVAMLWIGSGANGKTKLIELIMKLMKDRAGTASLNRFHYEADKAKTCFKGKTLVHFSEVGNKRMERVTMDIIKSLITDEFQEGREAYEKSSRWINQTKIIFTANKIPILEDPNDMAFFRRIEMIDFNQTFDGESCDKTIAERVFETEGAKVLSYIAVYNSSWKFEPDGNITKEKWLGISDNVRAFIKEKKIKEFGIDETITYYRNYTKWCADNGVDNVSKNTFVKHMDMNGVVIRDNDEDPDDPTIQDRPNFEEIE
jgi:phage/plasmid-associated DNA primase